MRASWHGVDQRVIRVQVECRRPCSDNASTVSPECVECAECRRELLQVTFASELLSPSRCIWLVSPWLRDTSHRRTRPVPSPRCVQTFLVQDVRVSVVLRELMNRGTRVVIAVRPDAGNRQLLMPLEVRKQVN